jgi:hypothetical protein
MASAIETYLLAMLTGNNAPPLVATDPSVYNSGNVTAAAAITKAWPMLPGTPVAGTVYSLETEFSGVWGGNAFGFSVQVGTAAWMQFFPSVGSGSFASAAAIGGAVKLTIRVLSASTARFAIAGTIAETASSWTPSTGQLAMAQGSSTLAIAAGNTVALGCLFGALTTNQNVTTYGSTFTTIGGAA